MRPLSRIGVAKSTRRASRLPGLLRACGAGLCMALGTTGVAAGSTTYSPVVNWASGYTLSAYGNTTVGDCSLAAAATYTQLEEHWLSPIPTGPLLYSYAKLAPGDSGLTIGGLLRAWHKWPLTGVRAAYATALPTSESALAGAISHGPVFLAMALPALLPPLQYGANFQAPWGPSSAAWGHPVAGHDAVAVGYDSTYLYVATWGTVVPIAWSVWPMLHPSALSIHLER